MTLTAQQLGRLEEAQQYDDCVELIEASIAAVNVAYACGRSVAEQLLARELTMAELVEVGDEIADLERAVTKAYYDALRALDR